LKIVEGDAEELDVSVTCKRKARKAPKRFPGSETPTLVDFKFDQSEQAGAPLDDLGSLQAVGEEVVQFPSGIVGSVLCESNQRPGHSAQRQLTKAVAS
jgi:hypothetical protein